MEPRYCYPPLPLKTNYVPEVATDSCVAHTCPPLLSVVFRTLSPKLRDNDVRRCWRWPSRLGTDGPRNGDLISSGLLSDFDGFFYLLSTTTFYRFNSTPPPTLARYTAVGLPYYNSWIRRQGLLLRKTNVGSVFGPDEHFCWPYEFDLSDRSNDFWLGRIRFRCSVILTEDENLVTVINSTSCTSYMKWLNPFKFPLRSKYACTSIEPIAGVFHLADCLLANVSSNCIDFVQLR